jgi:hypothetical protein
MKKLIYTILASSFLLSCSTDSSNEDSNNSSNSGIVPKTISEGNYLITYTYNGNKAVGYTTNTGDYGTATYNGDNIINWSDFSTNNESYIVNSTYSNNVLISQSINTNYTNPPYTENCTFIYNSDGSVTVNITKTTSTGIISQFKNIYFYTSGNLIKKEQYYVVNSIMTLSYITNYTYDNKNNVYKNITGINLLKGDSAIGGGDNNVTGYERTDATGNIVETQQVTYTYNSQNYPLSRTETNTSYTINPQTGISTPETPEIYYWVITYY